MKRLRLKLLTAIFCLGLMLTASATQSTAGVVPWVWNVLFGPSCSGSYCGGCGLTSCGGCYAPSPSYRAPMYSAPVYSAPAYSAPASPTYSVPVDSYPSGESTGCLPCVSETIVVGSTIYDGQVLSGPIISEGPVLSGVVISSYSPTVIGESYIGDSYVAGSVVQSGCSGTTTYLGETIVEGSIVEGSIVEGSTTEGSVAEDSEPSTFDPGSSTETMDAVGPTTEDDPDESVNNETVGSEETEPKVVDPDEPVIGGGRRRRRTGEDASSGIGEVPDFVDPVDPNDGRRKRSDLNDRDPLFDRESNKVVDPNDPPDPDGDAASPDLDAEAPGSDTVPRPEDDTNGIQDLDDSAKLHSDTPESVVADEAQPLDYEIRTRPIRGFPVRTMTARKPSQSTSNDVTVNAPFVLNKSKQTPLRWISIPGTTRIR